MKVGDYVRTKDYHNIRSRIGKIIRQDGKYYYLDIDEDTQMVWEKDTILTSSPNIIDLIEVGDYVNGKKVIDTYTDYIFDYTEEFKVIRFSETDILHDRKHIETIVTKEQFSCMEYKIGE